MIVATQIKTMMVELNEIIEFEATVYSQPTVRPKSVYLSLKDDDSCRISAVAFNGTTDLVYDVVSGLNFGDRVAVAGFFQPQAYMGEHMFTLLHVKPVQGDQQ